MRAAERFPRAHRSRVRRPYVAALAIALAVLAGPLRAEAPDPARDPVRIADDPDLGRLKRAQLLQHARAERRERRQETREAARGRAAVAKHSRSGSRLPARGSRLRPAPPEAQDLRLPAPPAAVSLAVAGVVPTNVRVNDKTGDASNAVQAEQEIALQGNVGLCAWNDGQGFFTHRDSQGAGITTDGGATWARVAIPHPAGAPTWYWFTDPMVAVDESTGSFWFGAVTLPDGIAVVRGSFSGGVFTWDTPHEVRRDPTGSLLFDKPWMVADSLSGNLYLTYTTFGAGTDSILFQRSTDDGATWESPVLMNVTPRSFGGVQGSRPAVGDGGEVYVVWQELGFAAADTMKMRVSHDRGASFGAETIVAEEYSNGGSGAPGYNRSNGFTFPAIAVDRTRGAFRGRVYVAWHEASNFYDDLLGAGGARSELEDNGTSGAANPFLAGAKLRGLTSPNDLDWWSFPAGSGTTYIFYCDSVDATTNYELRVLCSDGATLLAYGGSTDTGFPGQKAILCWTAPSSGTYFLRVRGLSGSGGYRIQTGVDAPGLGEHARDQRDAVVAWSQRGAAPWSAPARMNDDPVGYDDWLPEVAVGADGDVYGLWHDWRDAAADCGGSSQIYVSRSTDGGTTWAPNVRISSSPTHWTTTLANIAPNQGDYNALQGNDRLTGAWADGRAGDPDVEAAVVPLELQAGMCEADTTVAPGDAFLATWTVVNPNLLFDNTYALTLTDTRGWPLPAGGSVTVPAGGSLQVSRSFAVPAGDSGAVNRICLTLEEVTRAKTYPCCFQVRVSGTTAPARGPQLLGAWPNPARNGLVVALVLAPGQPATLELFDPAGRRVLAVDVTGQPAGSPVKVDLTDRAARLRPGVYNLRLTQAGRALTSRIAILR